MGIVITAVFEVDFLNSYNLSCLIEKNLCYHPPINSLTFPNPIIFVTLDVTFVISDIPSLFKGLSFILSSFELRHLGSKSKPECFLRWPGSSSCCCYCGAMSSDEESVSESSENDTSARLMFFFPFVPFFPSCCCCFRCAYHFFFFFSISRLL